MAYEDYCAACTYMGESSDYSGRYYCDRKGEYRYACDARCYNFCEAYSRSNYSRENMYKNSASHTSGGGCYITTIMCEILGYADDNYYLQTLRNFRDNVMKTNIKYIPLLLTYDIIGPMIAEKLSEDSEKQAIAQVFFNKYIIPAVNAINEQKYDTATNTYVAMTNALAEKYNINTNIIMPTLCEEDYPLLGHGKRRVRVKPETI